ncbi:flagellar hook protein FlgE [Cytobacillus eiseniae]|uniref:Flagellar hook protein FlgE n=1 Tax=Cytobacillus eiseniae TaxID=762947 RepID=A0ABS4RB55_9BACI|nr:flagellar hook protein FlgE [Cytobacillus eiseniae]MBP2240133.1 flagellar hook protein FlgE [Cytobacillus eiseniae]
MLRSMYSGISGMKNFQTKLDVIGNNIANVNTFGFKKGRVTFKDTMNQMVAGASAASENRGGKNPMQVGLGSTLATIDTIHTGASLQTTGRALDLGIDGDGYFVVKQGNAEFYSRAGNFYLDDDGNLVNGDGLKVQAYKVDSKTNLPTNQYGDVAVNVNAVLPATATGDISITENLSANATDGSIFTQQIKIVDDAGKEHKIDVHFEKSTTADTWNVYINADPAANPKPTADTTIAFDPATGIPTTTPTSFAFTPIATGTAAPAAPLIPGWTGATALNLNFKDLTQVDGATTAIVSPDGNTEGSLESFNIGSMGEINGVYSNGQVNTLGVLALAKFSNSSGLQKAGNNLFQASINSGTPNVGIPGSGRGTIAPGSLEMSNVDLSEEFTEMIVTQRGFQANTRIITTSDEILQELVNLKR